jgi:Tfp pilus assembly protein PilO
MIRLFLALLMLIVAGSLFFMYTKPGYDALHVTETKIAQYNAALDKAAELQQLKQTLLSRYNALDPNDLSRLQKMLPDHVDNIGLILELDNLASRYGMALANVDISRGSGASVSEYWSGDRERDESKIRHAHAAFLELRHVPQLRVLLERS